MRVAPVRVILFALLLGGSAVFLTLHYGGTLINDVAVRSAQMVPHPSARVIAAKCKRYFLLISACRVEYTDRAIPSTPSQPEPRHKLNYLIFGSAAGEGVALLQPLGRSDIVTTSVGMAHLRNRLVALPMLVGLDLVALFTLLSKILLTGRGSRYANTEQPDGNESQAIESAIDALAARHQAQLARPVGGGGAAPRPIERGGFGRRNVRP